MSHAGNPDNAQGDPPFDAGALSDCLASRIDGFDELRRVERFQGGQSNPTYLLETAREKFVLRKKPSGPLLPSAHAVEREFRVMTALAAAGMPVPRMVCLCEDPALVGTPFYVMAFVEGRIFWDPTLPGMTNSERAGLYDEMNRVIARLHALDPTAIGLADFGRAGNYMARQVARWSKQYLASETHKIAAMDKLIAWLPERIPQDHAVGVVHGDLRLDNMIFDPKQPRILALLDWELSTIGDPLADFGYHMLTWHLRSGDFRGMADADLPSLGIPPASDYLDRYVERTGRPAPAPETWNTYVVYNLFRLAAILQGIAKRAEEGTAASEFARETGAKTGRIAETAWRWVEDKIGTSS